MNASAQLHALVEAERPFFTTRESLDDMRSLSSVTFAHGDFSIGRYQRDRPGLGVSSPNPICAMVMAVVIHRARPAHAGWHDDRLVAVPALGSGALSCLDLREAWTMELSAPFDSFHAFIPWSAFDEVTSELRRPRIDALNRRLGVEHRDETMLGLARSLNPVLGRPERASALFTDHVFLAMVTHLTVTYGGFRTGHLRALPASRVKLLSHVEERRVTSRLLDDVAGDATLSELAALCGRSRSQFIRAFKQSTGMPPHRWLLMQRVERAKKLLQSTNMPIAGVALSCGFSDQSHLTRVFSKVFDITPGAWRRQWKR